MVRLFRAITAANSIEVHDRPDYKGPGIWGFDYFAQLEPKDTPFYEAGYDSNIPHITKSGITEAAYIAGNIEK